jgi:2-keto-3-deoxy-L-fuconate dehydrogenase
MLFQDRTIIITGAGSGIGAATAAKALHEGANLVAVDQDAESLSKLKELAPGRVETLIGDVSEATLAKEGVKLAQKFPTPLKGLVTAAGISASGTSIRDFTDQTWDRIFQVNVRGSWVWLKACLPEFESKGGGSAVFLASQLAFGGGRLNAAYIASKGAIVSLAKTAAFELAESGVRVNAVAPGAIDTPLLRKGMRNQKDPDAAIAYSQNRHAMKRFGRPEEIASPIIYLLTDEASFITGHTLLADGGWTSA